MKADAEKYKAEDEKKRKELDTLNGAESYAYSIEKTLNDENLKDVITEDDKKSISAKIEELRNAIASKNIAEVETKQKEVETAWSSVATKIYGKANSGANQNAGTSNPFAGAGAGFNPFDMADGFGKK